jgi:AraC family transcriptional regulator of arabinose operon
MERTDGFAHQRLSVMPAPLVDTALVNPVTRRLLVTDVGLFPSAEGHVRRRPTGTSEAIVMVCSSGSGWVETAGNPQKVKAGTAVVIPTGVPHSYGTDADNAWTIRWCHLRGTDVAELVDACGVAAGAVTIPLVAPERVVATLDELITSVERNHTAARTILASGIGWRLLTQLAADRSLPQQGAPLERAMRYLEERVESRITVPELASIVGVSPSHLAALFRDATGGGVVAYHLALKMGRARHLLDTTSLSIGEIAVAAGFEDAFYFSRQFRNLHGVSPRTYRDVSKG